MKKTVFLVSLIGLIVSISAFAAESKPVSLPSSDLPDLHGRIVALEKTARHLTVDVHGTLLDINVIQGVKLLRKGKMAKLDDFAPGQSISLSFIETPNGRLEVTTLAVDSPKGKTTDSLAKGPDNSPQVSTVESLPKLAGINAPK